MGVVTVQEIGKTSNGKPKVKASGSWYFMARNVEPPQAGSTVEIREGSFTFPDGAPAKTIEAWRPIQEGNGHAATPAAPPAGYIDEASMRFISNCVGSAITAGTIKEPGQIIAWFQAAKAALQGKEADRPFDDRVPF